MDTQPLPVKHLSREESYGYDRKTLDYIRNAAAHGFAAPELPAALPKLRTLVGTLAAEWWPAQL